MQLIYQHGVYAPLDASEDFTPPQSAGTLPLYTGTAPVHQLAIPPKAGEPILIRTWREMESLLGYSDDWADFDLCEACYAHLRSRVGSVAPIVVINLVDLAKHKSEGKTIQATFTAGRAVVAAPLAIRSTVKIASKTEGTDYAVSYSADGKSLILEDLTGKLTSETVNYDEVDVSKITASDVVKTINSQVPLIYQKLGLVPTILCCPRLGNEEGVYDALTAMAASIGGHCTLLSALTWRQTAGRKPFPSGMPPGWTATSPTPAGPWPSGMVRCSTCRCWPLRGCSGWMPPTATSL